MVSRIPFRLGVWSSASLPLRETILIDRCFLSKSGAPKACMYFCALSIPDLVCTLRVDGSSIWLTALEGFDAKPGRLTHFEISSGH